MVLRKVISGGQTGADRTALEEAKRIGLETGGTAPYNWRTDEGRDPSLADFGLVQSQSSDYKPRTHKNAKDSDCTVWFGEKSPGYYCTKAGCKRYGKEFYENPTELQLEYICNTYSTVNFAGNRKRTNPAVVPQVKDAFEVIRRIKQNSN
jgi:hypothetical protein